MKTKVSIIIPIYNEEGFIDKLIKKIKNVKLDNFFFEIICVNDGSTDTSLQILKKIKKIKIINQKNMGKGKAVQNGIAFATGDLCLIQDADLEYNPKDYKVLLEPFLKNKKISVYGSRFIEKKNFLGLNLFNKHNQSLTSFYFNYILSIIFFLKKKIFITDLLTGYKVYKKEFFEKIKLNTSGFETDHEITIALLENKYTIMEVPISFKPRTKEQGKKINFFDAIKAIKIILKS